MLKWGQRKHIAYWTEIKVFVKGMFFEKEMPKICLASSNAIAFGMPATNEAVTTIHTAHKMQWDAENIPIVELTPFL